MHRFFSTVAYLKVSWIIALKHVLANFPDTWNYKFHTWKTWSFFQHVMLSLNIRQPPALNRNPQISNHIPILPQPLNEADDKFNRNSKIFREIQSKRKDSSGIVGSSGSRNNKIIKELYQYCRSSIYLVFLDELSMLLIPYKHSRFGNRQNGRQTFHSQTSWDRFC